MNSRNAPLSPISVGSSEWMGYPMDNSGPYPNSRGVISPPSSGGSIGGMNGFPPGPKSVGGPSPPPSVGRSSTGTNLYARSESGRAPSGNTEAILGEHYVALKRFLSQTSRDGKPATPANKARDKLQRLTGIQFLELSTDVFDELIRRQAFARRPPNAPSNAGPPSYLLPEENFHPKRNQARQKLSSLGPPRFRDLATDVFCELERRYPRFVAGDIPRMGSPSTMSLRGPTRTGTPVNGFPPRGQSRVRRPSEASSIRGAPPSMANGYGIPPSPGLPNGYDRPMARQFQSNTIVPNKSTMVEEDDDISPTADAPVLSDGPTENDKRLIEDYESQLRELRERMNEMEENMKKKEEEVNSVLDGERSRATAANLEKKEWEGLRLNLENQLAEVQNLNDSMKEQLVRARDDHVNEVDQMRVQFERIQQSSNVGSEGGNPELQRENQELRMALQEQQQVTEEVRLEAQEFLREMKALSEQSSSAWEKQKELEGHIEGLELEVRDWRNRYARAKTQVRNMRASSLGLPVDQDPAKYIREKGFTTEDGLVKDVHVTKFQISIDEILRRARTDDPEKVIDSMKAVVVSVRLISKDLDIAAPAGEEFAQRQAKLKSRVSSTANNLITAAKNFATSAGLSPVSLLDAAASHLVSAMVELLRFVKIRPTPDGELEDDDGTVTPVDSTGMFSPRSNVRSIASVQDALPPPPAFQSLSGTRVSAGSSAYSPITSPRESVDRYSARPPMSQTSGLGNGMSYAGTSKNHPPASNGYGTRQDSQNKDLKIYLEDQTAVLVQTIQNMVGSVRSDAAIDHITEEIGQIANVVGKIIAETEASGNGGRTVERLISGLQRLQEAGDQGEDLAADGKGPGDREWRMWMQTLPPIAFEIARESKELIQRIDELLVNGHGGDDFS